MDITKQHHVCACWCVCMGMFIPGPLCLTPVRPQTPPVLLLLFSAKVRQSVETFLADLEAVIGVMRSG